jgi:type VII secretion protein EccB
MAMQSRKDLFQAHRLMTQRAALALLRGEPDVPDQPLRRLNVSAIISVLVGVIVAGIFGIWGLLFHGAQPLKFEPGTLVMDKQTGTAYVFCEKNNKDLCPEVNYASALLSLQSSSVTVQDVNQSSLTTIGHGPLLGIPGLPEDLPGKSLLITQPWSVCTQTLNGVAVVGTKTTTVVASGLQSGGRPIGSSLLLVSSLDQDWVIGDGQRFPVPTSTALSDLFPTAQPVSVPSAWLNALPQGANFEAPSIPGQGRTVTGPNGNTVTVGQLYTAQVSGSTRYFVTQQDGSLASITQTQFALLQAESSPAQQLNASQVNVTTKLPNALPATETSVVSPSSSTPLCVVLNGTGSGVTLQVETGGHLPAGGVSTNAPAGDPVFADRVALPAGKGALVRVAGDPNANSASYALVTGGHRYALASSSVVGFLGYSESQAVQLPAGVLDMIPSGPGLNPQQALKPAPFSG